MDQSFPYPFLDVAQDVGSLPSWFMLTWMPVLSEEAAQLQWLVHSSLTLLLAKLLKQSFSTSSVGPSVPVACPLM